MKVFTTGQVAKICKVAPRTVSKWFDSGRLKGYRIPGSQDRRIPREYLIRFLKEHGICGCRPTGSTAVPVTSM
jgi:excisionase family DNA binding protein